MSKARYLKGLSIAAATAAAVALVVGGVLISGNNGGASALEGQDTKEWFVPADEANYDLAILESDARSKATLPAELNLNDLGIDGLRGETVRLVAEVDGASTYVALDKSNLLCVVSYIPGDDWVGGSTCTTPESFSDSGVGLRLGSPADGTEVYLVPDTNASAVKSLAKSADVSIPQKNLVVVDYELSADRRAQLVKLFDGQPIPFFKEALSNAI